jgi:hypothetical protein
MVKVKEQVTLTVRNARTGQVEGRREIPKMLWGNYPGTLRVVPVRASRNGKRAHMRRLPRRRRR